MQDDVQGTAFDYARITLRNVQLKGVVASDGGDVERLHFSDGTSVHGDWLNGIVFRQPIDGG